MFLSKIKVFFLILLFLPTILLSEKLQKITLQLNWLHQFEYAGYYAAKEKGFYKDAGLDVEFIEMSFDKKDSVINDVISGKTNYAIDYSSIIRSHLEGEPLVFVANFFKHSPLVLVTQKNIKTPGDLAGKKIMGGNDALKNTAMYLMLSQYGIDEKQFTNVPQTFKIDEFLKKEVDATTIFLTNQAYRLNKEGIEYNILNPEKYGAEFYIDNLFTSKKEALENPLRVKAFRDATIKGWQYALGNKDEIIDTILEKYNTQNKTKSQLKFEAIQTSNLILDSVYPIGSIDPKRVKRIAETYIQLGVVPKSAKINFINGFIFESRKHVVNLSNDEVLYLKNKKVLNLCIDPNWMPFEEFDKNGKYNGITSDYFKLFQKELPVPIKVKKTTSWIESLEAIKNRECDILSSAMNTLERVSYLDFTSSYISTPLILVTKTDIPFIEDLKLIENKKIGITKGYIYENLIRKQYPDFNVIEVENIDEGLKKVVKGELFGYVGALSTAAYKFKSKYVGELKIASKFDDKLEFSIATRNDEPMLKEIFEQLLQSINQAKRQEILNKYISISFESKVDYTLVYISIGVFLIILSISLYWTMKLKREKKKTEETLVELKKVEKLLEERNSRLQKISLTDTLTRINNREKLNTELKNEIARSERSNIPFSLIMLDIDHFKEVNDSYGHQVGDDILIEFTKIIESHVRKIDTFGRWGGEEFIIICPNTNAGGAMKKAEEIRKLIESHKFLVVGKKTASFGVATYKDDDNEKTLIYRVDMAMYRAKQNGRNQVIFFN